MINLITRRAALFGAAASSAALAVPAVQALEPQPVSLPDGHCQVTIAGRRLAVNLNAVPQHLFVVNREEGAGGWTDHISRPDDEAAEYLAVDYLGQLVVVHLVEGMDDAMVDDLGNQWFNRRKGWVLVEWPGDKQDYVLRQPVTVIGKVIG